MRRARCWKAGAGIGTRPPEACLLLLLAGRKFSSPGNVPAASLILGNSIEDLLDQDDAAELAIGSL
jgi:hypothetical protein